MNRGKFGVNCWWHVPGCVIDGELAKEAMKLAGFDGMLPKPTRHAEVSRATRSVAGRRRKADKSIAEKVGDNSSSLVYGILDYDQEGQEAEYQQKTTVHMDKATGVVKVEGEKADRVIAAVQVYEGKVTDEDVRQFLVNVVAKCHGVSKRHGGGIYFIPAQYVDRIEAAQKVLREIGSGAKVYVERVVDGEQERRNVWEACEENISKQIEDTLAACEKIEKRASAVEDKQAKLSELEDMMGVYKGLLGEEAKYEELAERIEAAVQKVSEKMAQIQQGTAASVVERVVVEEVKVEEKAPVAQVAASKADRIPVVDAAVAVLMKAGKALTSREVYERAVREGWYVSEASDPYTSFVSVLSKAVSKGDKRIQRVGTGVWGVAA
jgi:hypothetical protein